MSTTLVVKILAIAALLLSLTSAHVQDETSLLQMKQQVNLGYEAQAGQFPFMPPYGMAQPMWGAQPQWGAQPMWGAQQFAAQPQPQRQRQPQVAAQPQVGQPVANALYSSSSEATPMAFSTQAAQGSAPSAMNWAAASYGYPAPSVQAYPGLQPGFNQGYGSPLLPVASLTDLQKNSKVDADKYVEGFMAGQKAALGKDVVTEIKKELTVDEVENAKKSELFGKLTALDAVKATSNDESPATNRQVQAIEGEVKALMEKLDDIKRSQGQEKPTFGELLENKASIDDFEELKPKHHRRHSIKSRGRGAMADEDYDDSDDRDTTKHGHRHHERSHSMSNQDHEDNARRDQEANAKYDQMHVEFDELQKQQETDQQIANQMATTPQDLMFPEESQYVLKYGEYCDPGGDLTTQEQCQAAATSLTKKWGERENPWYGMNDHRFCFFADDGWQSVYFNTAEAANAAQTAPRPNYASLCLQVCATQVVLAGGESVDSSVMGTFTKSAIVPSASHGGRAIYENEKGRHLYYWQPVGNWIVETDGDIDSSFGVVFAHSNSHCPESVGGWKLWENSAWSTAHPLTITKVAEVVKTVPAYASNPVDMLSSPMDAMLASARPYGSYGPPGTPNTLPQSDRDGLPPKVVTETAAPPQNVAS